MARILLIDDDEPVRTIVSGALTHFGHSVIEARDGVEGLELFAHAATDLVITDLVMPRKSGREVMRVLREQKPLVKIIAMSGGDRSGLLNALSSAKLDGAAQVLAKPFTIPALLAVVQEVLASGDARALDRSSDLHGTGPAGAE